jgi:hypothetical protein
MLNYDEFNRLIIEQARLHSTVATENDDKIMVIYQSNALDVQKGVAFDGVQFFTVTYTNGNTTVDTYSKIS